MKMKRLLVLVLSMLLGLFALSACAKGDDSQVAGSITYYAVLDGTKQDLPEKAKAEGKTYPTEYKKGDSVTIPDLNVTYTVTVDGVEREIAFGGWFNDEACTKAFTGITSKSVGNITVYAKLVTLPLEPAAPEEPEEPEPVKRTITYKAVIGKTIGDIPTGMFIEDGDYPVEYVETVSVLTISNLKNFETYEGDGSGLSYEFKGWFTDEACTKAFTGITTETTGNITLYAKIIFSYWSPTV